MLTLAEEYLLFELHTYQGKVSPYGEAMLPGTLMLQLALSNCVQIDPQNEKHLMATSDSVNDDLLREALNRVQTLTNVKWLSNYGEVPDLTARLLKRLLEKGLVRQQEKRGGLLWLSHMTVHMVEESIPKQELLKRIRDMAAGQVPPAPQTVVLMYILNLCAPPGELNKRDIDAIHNFCGTAGFFPELYANDPTQNPIGDTLGEAGFKTIETLLGNMAELHSGIAIYETSASRN